MADSPAHPNAGDDTGAEPGRGSPPGTPRWVKVFGIVAIVLVVLAAVALVTGLGGPGGHGPGRHTRSSDGGGQIPPSSDTERRQPAGGDRGGHAPPEGGH